MLRADKMDLLGRLDKMSRDQAALISQLNDMRAILQSFDQRLSTFSSLDESKRSKWSPSPGLSSPRDSLAQGLDLAPSNPLALPGSTGKQPRGMSQILITPQLLTGLLPKIPNLEAGYLYSFGNSVSAGMLTLDLLVPIRLGKNSVVFGEVHNEWQDFWKTVTRGSNHKVDLSIGWGYRTIFRKTALLGVNGFYDTTRLAGKWYSSGSVGLEMAALLPGSDAVDLSFNWYGNLFNSNVLANAFRRGPENYDFRAGYSHELWDGGPDLRLSATGYRFSTGTGVYGVRCGAAIKSRDGVFTVEYEAGNDRVNGTYHTVGGFVNVGLRMENLLAGESPFVKPEPIFRSPRNLAGQMTLKVKRSWRQAVAIVTSAAAGPSGPTVHLPITVQLQSPFNCPGNTGVRVDIVSRGPLTFEEVSAASTITVQWSGGFAPVTGGLDIRLAGLWMGFQFCTAYVTATMATGAGTTNIIAGGLTATALQWGWPSGAVMTGVCVHAIGGGPCPAGAWTPTGFTITLNP